jgi:nucleotide-binding universal stress UspA family protein
MEKNLLLAIDGSRNSLLTLDYVSHFFRFCPEVRMVLYHVLPPIPPIHKEYSLRDTSAHKYIREWRKKHQEAIEQVLNQSKHKLVKLGWKAAQIQIRAHEKRVGVARDIIFEAGKGIYDAVVLGRRGLSKIEEAFLGSVSTKIIQGVRDTPVWIVGGKFSSPKVLVAVDGSENSLRAVDHLSFMLDSCPNQEIKVLLLNVWPGFITLLGPPLIPALSAFQTSLEKYEKRVTPIFNRSEEMLIEAGLTPYRIKRKVGIKAADIAKAVIAEARRGGYGTIVVGRRGLSKAKEFFMGSVSSKILQQAGETAVWIVS